MIIFLDLETNGIGKCSVLQFAAIKLKKIDLKNGIINPIEKIDKYYFPNEGEKFNFFATKVHGITSQKIITERKNSSIIYPKTFLKEFERGNDNMYKFFKGIDTIAGHNIDFDLRFFPNWIQNKKRLCTMKLNKKIVCAEDKLGRIKFPKLIECIKHYDLEYDETKLHSAIYDIEMTAKVFGKTLLVNKFDF